ncbi:BolA/IbaG family iron-sulfur metabolism protein [Porticoccaceae bacterium]|nr:BolA/IbaG family iron-sulfur metabolism protein [Porticoccaceae bacterium]
MTPEQVNTMLTQAFADSEIRVEGEGSHYNIVVVGDCFEGKRSVQRQQLVYAVLNEVIASGEVHAVNMKLFTRNEWAQRS